MTNKNTPVKGRTLTIQIILPTEAEIKIEGTDSNASRQLKKHGGKYSVSRNNGREIIIKSMRQLKLFAWLQGKEQTFTTGVELSKIMGVNRNQALKTLYELKMKGLVYYTHDGSRIKIVRVDDIALLNPQFDGVENEG